MGPQLILLMKKRLNFENWRESEEMQDVRQYMKHMQSEIHCSHDIQKDDFKKIGEERICVNKVHLFPLLGKG